METASFDEWLNFVFDRPIDPPGKFWWWEPEYEEAIVWTGSPLLLQSFLVRLFQGPDLAFSRFSEAQVAQGLWFAASEARPGYFEMTLREPVPMEARVQCVDAMFELFSKGFAPH